MEPCGLAETREVLERTEEAVGAAETASRAGAPFGHDDWCRIVSSEIARMPADRSKPGDFFVLCHEAWQVEHLVRACGVDPDAAMAWRGIGGGFDDRSPLYVLSHSLRYWRTVAALLAEGARVDTVSPARRLAYNSSDEVVYKGYPGVGSALSTFARSANIWKTSAEPGDEECASVVYAFLRGRGADAPEFRADVRAAAVVASSCSAALKRPLRAPDDVLNMTAAVRRRLPRDLVRVAAQFLGLGLCPRPARRAPR